MASVPHPCTRRKDGAPPSSLPQALQRWYSHMDASRKRRKKEKKRGPPARAILRPEAILSLTSYLNPFWWVPKVFSDDWLATRLAAILFFFSTFCVLVFTPVFPNLNASLIYLWQRILSTVLALVVTVGIFFLWIGMWRYWMRLDRSRVWVKRMWFLVLLVGFWWGSCLYYFLGYLPQVIRRARSET